MAATVSHVKEYAIGPQDGWVEIVDATSTNLVFLRISAYPHTKPFNVFSGTSAPSNVTDQGISVCHHPFKIANYTNTNASKFWVRVNNTDADSRSQDGRTRIDVYADGGVLQ